MAEQQDIYQSYPSSYILCFNETCKLANECVHRIATQHIRDDNVAGFAVFPTMAKRKSCQYYKKFREIRAAWGFKTIFRDARQRDAPVLRAKIKAFLGGNGTYYLYHHGELKLTPEQQQWIINLFKKYGDSSELQFDNYIDIIDW